MAREPTREIGPAAAIRPIATPVDTYVRPEDPAPSNLGQLADSLARFDSRLAGFLKKRRGDQDEKDAIRGAAEFVKNNSQGYEEAVRKGLIPANQSPIFIQSWKKSQGNLEGMRLKDKFNDAWSKWEGRDAGDSASFDAFVTGFLAENLQTEDPDVLRGLMPHITEIVDGSYLAHINESGERAYKDAVRTGGAVGSEIIGGASQKGIETGEGTDYDAVWASLIEHRTETLKSGIKHEDFDASMVDTIIAKAIEEGDPQLLELLEKTLPGDTLKLSAYPDVAAKKAQAISDLETMAVKRMTAQDKAAKEADKQAEDAIVQSVNRALYENINAEVPEEVLKQWEKYDPAARSKLADIRKKLIDGGAQENPKELLELYDQIRKNPERASEIIGGAVQSGIIRTHTGYKQAFDFAENYSGEASKGANSVLKSDAYTRYIKVIKDRTMPQGIDDPFGSKGMSDEGLQASEDFEAMLIDWAKRNPDASLMDREKAINDIGRIILERITSDGTSDPTYTSQSEYEAIKKQQAEQTAGNQNRGQLGDPAPVYKGEVKPDGSIGTVEDKPKTFREQMRIEAPIGRYQPALGPYDPTKDPGVAPFVKEQPPAWEDLTEDQQSSIDAVVEQTGATREEVTMGMWKKISEWMKSTAPAPGSDAGAKVEKMSYGIDETITNAIKENQVVRPKGSIAAQFSEDPEEIRAAGLFDLFGKSEGTDKGRGYNETLGYGDYTGGDRELTSMTLDQIDKLQTQMLRHPDNYLNSSALGRFQIIRTTLREERKKLGLKGNELFDEKMQNKIAMSLLRKRGYDDWKAGKISDTQFLNNLALEWASVPKVTGKGAYKGQNASVKVREVLAILAGIKNSGSVVA